MCRSTKVWREGNYSISCEISSYNCDKIGACLNWSGKNCSISLWSLQNSLGLKAHYRSFRDSCPSVDCGVKNRSQGINYREDNPYSPNNREDRPSGWVSYTTCAQINKNQKSGGYWLLWGNSRNPFYHWSKFQGKSGVHLRKIWL